MQDHYQVKFQNGTETVYGVVRCVNSSDMEVQTAAQRGCCIVDHAVLPVAYEVAEDRLIDIPLACGDYDPATDRFTGCDEYNTYVQAQRDQVRQQQEVLPEGLVPGKMFRLGVGDGYAYYVVTRVGKTKTRVEWRGFCMDRWQDYHFGLGGSFPTEDVERYVRLEDSRRQLWRKHKLAA
jgi:hypothetical protein